MTQVSVSIDQLNEIAEVISEIDHSKNCPDSIALLVDAAHAKIQNILGCKVHLVYDVEDGFRYLLINEEEEDQRRSMQMLALSIIIAVVIASLSILAAVWWPR